MIEKTLETYGQWTNLPMKQQPLWPCNNHLNNVLHTVRTMPPLVSSQEVLKLREKLARVVDQNQFVLQGGDCAERFLDCNSNIIENKVNLLLEMGNLFENTTNTSCVLLGRIAGQYAKPRSGDDPYLFRGDNVNSFGEEERKPNPDRLLKGYYTASATLNYIRTMITQVNESAEIQAAATMAKQQDAPEPIADPAGGQAPMMPAPIAAPTKVDYHTSHEALLLPYEDALTREIDGKMYNLSAPFIWIGDRTRQVDHAHIHYARNIENPIGIKVGPSMSAEELIDLLKFVWKDPEQTPGKITLITRYGIDKVRKFLPHHIRAVQSIGFKVIWSCDPCHGNTFVTSNGFKTRHFSQMLGEVEECMKIHAMMGSRLHGVHLEMTAEDVTECVGDGSEPDELALAKFIECSPPKYETYCDPRLNFHQSISFTRRLAAMFAMVDKHLANGDGETIDNGNPLCSMQ